MRKYSVVFLVLLVISPLVFIGCPNGLEPLLPLESHEVRASIADYGQFDSKDATGALQDGNYILKAPILGTSGSDTLVITLVIPAKTQTPYTVDVASDPAAVIDYCVQQSSGTCIDYDARQGLGSGSITVNSVTSGTSGQIVEGTFSGTLVANNGSGDKKYITNGEFKVVVN